MAATSSRQVTSRGSWPNASPISASSLPAPSPIVTNRCGKAGCRCHATPPQLHGHYYQWTAKVDGQDLTRRLSENQATLYQEWISNDRQLRAQMRGVSAKATELIMKDTSTKALRLNRKLR